MMLGMMKRELKLSYRRKADLANPLLFFLMMVVLFPLGVTPNTEKLAVLAPGLVWVAALLSTLLSLDMMFRDDYEDGSLEQILLAAAPAELLVSAKIIAHWLMTGLPLTLFSPFLALSLAMPDRAIPALMISLALGTLAFSLIGSVGAALTVGLRKGGLLLSLLVMPLFIPILIFGASAVASAAQMFAYQAQLAYVAAICLGALAIVPWITTMALKVSVSE